MSAPESPRVPPRFVPTLTEVVQPGPTEVPETGAVATAPSAITEQQLVQRVMRRVQQGLDQRLREAVAQVVLEHTRSLGPAIAVEVESVVRALVVDALAEERAR